MVTLEQQTTGSKTGEAYPLFEYCFNDPVNSYDPTGLAPQAPATAPPVAPSPVSKTGPLWTPDPPIGTQAAQAFLQGQIAVSMAQAFMGPPGHVPMSEFSFSYWRSRLANDVQNGAIDANQANALIQSFHIDASKIVDTYVVGDPVVQANGRFIIPVKSGFWGGPLQVGAPAPTAAWIASYNAAKAATAAAKNAPAANKAPNPAPAPQPAAFGGAGNPPPPTTQASTQPSKNYINLSTAGLAPDEITDLKEYVRRTNAWLAINNGAVVKSTTALAAAKAAAVRAEKDRMTAAGTPFPASGAQLGHVPDTALSGQADPLLAVPPGGWLVMRGKANSVAGGALGPLAPNSAGRVGQHVDGFTVDGSLP